MVSMSGSGGARIRANFSVLHLLAAASFSRRVAEIEHEHAEEQFGPFYDDVLANASACILLSVASLEAYANKLFIDWEKHLPSMPEAAMESIWGFAERQSLTDKFDLFLRLREAPAIDRGKTPYQDIRALVELRNALTHIQPEWDDEQSIHKKVSNALRGKFSPSPFLSKTDPLFPKGWATAECTKWAVNACQKFVFTFADLATLEYRFEKYGERLIQV